MTDPYPPSPLPAHGPALISVQRIPMAAFGSAEAQEWLEETDSEEDSEEDEDSSEDSDLETSGKCPLGLWFSRQRAPLVLDIPKFPFFCLLPQSPSLGPHRPSKWQQHLCSDPPGRRVFVFTPGGSFLLLEETGLGPLNKLFSAPTTSQSRKFWGSSWESSTLPCLLAPLQCCCSEAEKLPLWLVRTAVTSLYPNDQHASSSGTTAPS